MSKYTEKERRFMQSMHDRSVELYEHIRDLALRAARDEETEQGDAATQRSVDGSERQDLRRTVEVRSADGDGSNPSRISETNQPAASPTSDSPLSAGWPTSKWTAVKRLGLDGFEVRRGKGSLMVAFENEETAEFVAEMVNQYDAMVETRDAALTAAREENEKLSTRCREVAARRDDLELRIKEAWEVLSGTHSELLIVAARRVVSERDAARAASRDAWKALGDVFNAVCPEKTYRVDPATDAQRIIDAVDKLRDRFDLLPRDHCTFGIDLQAILRAHLRPAAAATREVTPGDINELGSKLNMSPMGTDCTPIVRAWCERLGIVRPAAPAAMQRETPTVGSGHLSREYKSDEALKAAGMLPLAQPAARGVVTEAMRKVIGHNWPGNGTRCAWDRKEPCAVTIYYNTEAEAHDAFSAVTVAREDLAGLSEPIQFAPAAPQKASAAS